MVKDAGDFPLRQLIDKEVNVALSTGRPTLYQSTLIDEYMIAREEGALGIDDLIQLSRRSIELSYLDAERKDALLRRFDVEVKAARAKWL